MNIKASQTNENTTLNVLRIDDLKQISNSPALDDLMPRSEISTSINSPKPNHQ